MQENPNKNTDFASAFARGLRVIGVFNLQNSALNFAEVARLSELNIATARRLVLTLQTLGYAQQVGTKFKLTPKVLELGYAYLSSMGLPELAEPFLDEISDKIGESCSICALSGSDIVYIARRPTSRIMSVSLHIGTKLPALWTAMGRVLLAGQSDREINAVIESAKIVPYTHRTITTKAGLWEAIKNAQENGYCAIDQELELGLRAIAVPLKNKKNNVVAALNVSTHTSRMNMDALQKNVLPIIKKTSAALQKIIQ